MQDTTSYSATDAAVPFFRSKWGLLTLIAVGSGLYLYQRQGGSLKSLFSKVWDLGISAREKIGAIAPSVSGQGSNYEGATIQ